MSDPSVVVGNDNTDEDAVYEQLDQRFEQRCAEEGITIVSIPEAIKHFYEEKYNNMDSVLLNPKKYVNEYCSKGRIKLSYEHRLLTTGEFECTLKVGKLVAKASGRKKKDAEKLAAAEMTRILFEANYRFDTNAEEETESDSNLQSIEEDSSEETSQEVSIVEQADADVINQFNVNRGHGKSSIDALCKKITQLATTLSVSERHQQKFEHLKTTASECQKSSAKSAAVEQMVTKILHDCESPFAGDMSDEDEMSTSDLNTDSLSSIVDEMPSNALQNSAELNAKIANSRNYILEYCETKGIEPEYEHCWEFDGSFGCTLQVGLYKTRGNGSTKRSAEKMAAQEMVELILGFGLKSSISSDNYSSSKDNQLATATAVKSVSAIHKDDSNSSDMCPNEDYFKLSMDEKHLPIASNSAFSCETSVDAISQVYNVFKIRPQIQYEALDRIGYFKCNASHGPFSVHVEGFGKKACKLEACRLLLQVLQKADLPSSEPMPRANDSQPPGMNVSLTTCLDTENYVSQLNIYCQQHFNAVPKYTFMSGEAGELFCRAGFREHEVSIPVKNKKQSKQEAARMLFDLIKSTMPATSNDTDSDPEPTGPTVNYVTKLNNYCQMKNYPYPQYIYEVNTVTGQLCCKGQLLGYDVCMDVKTRKMGKQNVAQELLKQLIHDQQRL